VADPRGIEALLERIVSFAREDENVRALVLTSSRASGRHMDRFSDLDPILYVRDPQAIARDRAWTARFARVLVSWGEDLPNGKPPRYFRGVVYEDGSKADFTISPVSALEEVVASGRLSDALDVGYKVLVDKDGLATRLPPASFRAHIPSPPSQEDFAREVNDFWWNSTYVAKALWRDELFFAKHCLDQVLKLQGLRRMLEWFAETERGWNLNPGTLGRHLKRNLPPDLWSEVEASFAGGGIEENWEALFRTTAVYRRVATEVAARLGLDYPQGLDERVSAYLGKVRASRLA
jgi:aminoglycoside 6-adenylyltransferase